METCSTDDTECKLISTKTNRRKGDIKPHDSHTKDQLLSLLLLIERRKRIHQLQPDIRIRSVKCIVILVEDSIY